MTADKLADRSILTDDAQGFLKELVTALDAMPRKRLIRNQLMDPHGDFCAIGAICWKRGLDFNELFPLTPIARKLGIEVSLFRCVVSRNDIALRACSPAERWQKMRDWAESHTIPETAPRLTA